MRRLISLLLLLPILACAARPDATAAAQGVYLGVYQPGAPGDPTRLDAFEKDAGKRAAIVLWYQSWATHGALDLAPLRTVAARGSVPLITWEPWDPGKGADQPAYSLAAIAAGAHDTSARAWASGLAAYGGPVLLRWGHEMNGTWYPWGRGVNGNTPDQYVAAWRRLRSIFLQEGARNVQWVWSPNVAWDAASAFDAYFPGEDQVEWVALDGYNWGNGTNGGIPTAWQSFTQVFGPSYQRITALSAKPVMIAEMASAEAGGNKAAWIQDALSAQIPAHYPRVRAIVWFNENKERDWRITSSSRAQRAFARAVSAPTYLARWP